MKIAYLITAIFAFLILSQIQTSFATQEMNLSFKMDSTKINSNDIPVIRGSVHDEKGNPIINAKVQIPFSKETVESFTDSAGNFVINSSIPESIGQHMISVLVFKEGFDPIFGSITFEVSNKTTVIHTINDTEQNSTASFTDPIAQILQKQIDAFQQQQEVQEKKKQDLLEKNSILNQQREQAKQSLQNDLVSMEKQYDENSPRNAFLRFIQNIDSFVQGIFLDSFALTEQKSNDAHQAKINALADGKSSKEAMTIFQNKATITRDEVIDLNKNLNIKYNRTNTNIQDTFNSQGKLPRTESQN